MAPRCVPIGSEERRTLRCSSFFAENCDVILFKTLNIVVDGIVLKKIQYLYEKCCNP